MSALSASSDLVAKMKSSLTSQSLPQDQTSTSTPVNSSLPSDQFQTNDVTDVQTEGMESGMEAVVSAIPTALQQSDPLNIATAVGGGTSKESPLLNVSVEKPVVDAAGGVQVVELERNSELPPEVEGFLQKVENHTAQIPDEIVISNPQTGASTPKVLAQPVIILPITPEIEKKGAHKQAKFSIRWLVEWSRKMMKMFSGKIVYREASSD